MSALRRPGLAGSDEVLVARAQHGDRLARAALAARYERTATGHASVYFIPGADRDDIEQEARVGILNAIRSYRTDTGVPFGPFASMCIERQIITALKTAQRGKHRVLSEAQRIGYTKSGEEVDVADLLPSTLCRDPLLVLLDRERLWSLLVGLKQLTKLERQSILGISAGISYADLSAATGTGEKAIDNAAQRARRKLAA